MTARKIKEAIGAASWAKDILAACHAAKAEIEKGSRSTDFVNIYWKVK